MLQKRLDNCSEEQHAAILWANFCSHLSKLLALREDWGVDRALLHRRGPMKWVGMGWNVFQMYSCKPGTVSAQWLWHYLLNCTSKQPFLSACLLHSLPQMGFALCIFHSAADAGKQGLQKTPIFSLLFFCVACFWGVA